MKADEIQVQKINTAFMLAKLKTLGRLTTGKSLKRKPLDWMWARQLKKKTRKKL